MKRVPQIESDTPLRPRAVAEGVWEEASVWLDQPLPRRWLRELIAQANTVYAHNQRFRRRLEVYFISHAPRFALAYPHGRWTKLTEAVD